MSKLTKSQLLDENTALRVEIDRLRNEVASLKSAPVVSNTRFPHVDRMGRPCRIEMAYGREVRSYPATH